MIIRGSSGDDNERDEIVKRKQSRRARQSISRIAAKINPASYRARNKELGEEKPVGNERG